MPGFTTHYLFGRDVYHNIATPQFKQIIKSHLNAYKLGLQGPDIFFYYLPSLSKNSNKKTGSIMHTTNTGLFFKTYLDNISNLTKEQQAIAFSYITGFICHYVLDTKTHPFIYSRSGFRTTLTTDLDCYHANHRTLETNIDTVLLKRFTNKKPSDFCKECSISLSKKEDNVISNILSLSINKTYNNPSSTYSLPHISPFYVHNAILSMKLETFLLKDKTGIKKSFVQKIENKFTNCDVISSLISDDNYKDTNDCLNEQNAPWCLPFDESTYRTSSFTSLYTIALKKASDILLLIGTYVEYQRLNSPNTKNAYNKLITEIGNYSYHSGLDCDYVIF